MQWVRSRLFFVCFQRERWLIGQRQKNISSPLLEDGATYNSDHNPICMEIIWIQSLLSRLFALISSLQFILFLHSLPCLIRKVSPVLPDGQFGAAVEKNTSTVLKIAVISAPENMSFSKFHLEMKKIFFRIF